MTEIVDCTAQRLTRITFADSLVFDRFRCLRTLAYGWLCKIIWLRAHARRKHRSCKVWCVQRKNPVAETRLRRAPIAEKLLISSWFLQFGRRAHEFSSRVARVRIQFVSLLENCVAACRKPLAYTFDQAVTFFFSLRCSKPSASACRFATRADATPAMFHG